MRTFTSHRLHWVVESLLDSPSYEEKSMFGCRGCYLHGELKLVLAAQSEPWKGLLVPTGRDHHDALREQFPCLVVHPVLKKWLYLPEDQEDFEEVADKIVRLVSRNDPRIGVEPTPKKRIKRAHTRRGPGS